MTLKCTLNYIPKEGQGGPIDAMLTGNDMVVEDHEEAQFQPGDRFEIEHDGRTDMLMVAAPAYSEERPDGSGTRWHIPIKRSQRE